MVCVTSVTWSSDSSASIGPDRNFSDEPNIGTDYAGKKISNVIELIVDVDKMGAHSCGSCPPAQNAAVPGAAV
jgi:hypothetical protein